MNNLGNKDVMADNIQYYMDRMHKSRTDLCKALGIKYTTLCDWLNAKTYPRIDKIELMARYFGITKADLVEIRIDDTEARNIEAAKVALFGGAGDVTDEMWNEVIEFARFVEAKEAAKRKDGN